VPEDVLDLGPAAVDRRHEDVRGPVVGELHDQLGEVGLLGGDAMLGEGLVEADLLGGHRLHLHHFGDALALHDLRDDAVGLGRVAGPVHRRPAMTFASSCCNN
jgi:hypothetical protein